MITDKHIQKVIREAPASGKNSIELKDPGERGAGRLALVVRPMANRVSSDWYVYFYREGKRTKAKLGSYPNMSVAEARRRFLIEYSPAISAGDDPTAHKDREPSAGTVGELFSAYLDNLRRDGKRTAGNAHDYLFGIDHRKAAERGDQSSRIGGAAKAIGVDRPAASVTPGDIVPHLASIFARGSRVHANTVRAYISAAFNFGLRAEHDFTRANVNARWGLKMNPVAAIPADTGARRAGDRFLSPAEFRVVWRWLDQHRGRSRIASAVMLKMALGQRTEEILRISDTGYDRARAMINWQKTKNGLAHSIPLPHQAVSIIDALGPNSHGWFFPHMRNPAECAPYDGLRLVIARFLEKNPGFSSFTARDLRRTWKTLAGDAGISKDMRDRLQNHARGGDVSSRHYDRYDYLPERRAAMAKWAAYLDLLIEGKVDQLGGPADNVVQIGKGAVA
jgi:hypothetical protein